MVHKQRINVDFEVCLESLERARYTRHEATPKFNNFVRHARHFSVVDNLPSIIILPAFHLRFVAIFCLQVCCDCNSHVDAKKD